MDVDSTLAATEGIDLLAGIAGVGEQVAAITERAMQGELDFAASLRERVGLLAGLSAAAIGQANAAVRLNPGAQRLVDGLRERGWEVGLVSGGFTAMVEPLAAGLGIELVQANILEVAGGQLTGRLTGSIVDRAGNAAALRRWAAELAASTTVAMGDGANDLDMMAAADLSIAFHAKPAVQAKASAAIVHGPLDQALEIIDAEVGGP
ncbi:MAG: phosphoserine phosphatase SerB [Bifidobacteriaceae bacterium]|jgi:phosphoserine phosphatase|nr:phosphoserine phosphatase SerB [Bifidobacteriaceae bacterium]